MATNRNYEDYKYAATCTGMQVTVVIYTDVPDRFSSICTVSAVKFILFTFTKSTDQASRHEVDWAHSWLSLCRMSKPKQDLWFQNVACIQVAKLECDKFG